MTEYKNHIFIATTFRDFNGSKNDSIQCDFLDSLSRQTFKNFTLAVTIFNEKNVEKVIRNKDINSVIFKNKIPENNKFSLSDVFLNGLRFAELNDGVALIWTTCDVIFPDNFLEIFNQFLTRDAMITSHPHKSQDGLNEYSLSGGFDLIAFGCDFLKNKKNHEYIDRYRFYDWGVFEHFLIALGKNHDCNAINIYKNAPIMKYANDRKPGNETNNWLLKSWASNKVVFDSFNIDNNSSSLFFDLRYCHFQFEMPDINLKDYWFWKKEYYFYYIFLFKKILKKIFSTVSIKILRESE